MSAGAQPGPAPAAALLRPGTPGGNLQVDRAALTEPGGPLAPAPRSSGLDAAAPGLITIPPPQPDLLEPSASFPDKFLPRIAPDGRRPSMVYARPFDPADRRPRVALIVDGIGLAESDSREAIRVLPGAIDLAFSAYAPHPQSLLAAARAAGHEFFASLPMEPTGYPLNDEGFRSLLTGGDPGVNAQNLEWALSRIAGYVGVTAASDGLRGERYAQTADPFAALLDEIGRRGLLYLDPRPGARLPPIAPARSVDVIIDRVPNASAIDAELALLERVAHDQGSAIGLAGPLRPVTIERIAAWANDLDAHGLALAPVSAVITGPPPRPLPAEVDLGASPP